MAEERRPSGIDIVSDVPWGTHLCQFYQTEEDLIDILVPYFKAGLENNEFCMWVTSQPLEVEEAKAALKAAVGDLDDYLEKGQIEILGYGEWYTQTGTFDSDSVLAGWVKKENEAIARGFDGLRLTGNTFWLEKGDWRAFTEYEAAVNDVIGRHRMIALCSYALDRCDASEVIDVVSNHQFALIRRNGEWTVIESTERKQAEESLRESEEKFRSVFEDSGIGMALGDSKGRYVQVNKAMTEIFGYSQEELLSMGTSDITYPGDPTPSSDLVHQLWTGESDGFVLVHRQCEFSPF